MITLSKRQKEFAFSSAAGVALVGVSLLCVNVLSNWLYLRWDLTASNAYSLSPSSKKLMRSLDEPVIVKAYFSENLPAPYNTYSRYVRDILNEYRAASRGQLRYEFISPVPGREFEEQAMSAGMSPLQFQEMGSDQLQIRRGFMGLSLFYKDRSETLAVIKSFDQLEFDLTSRLARMTRKSKKKVLVTLGHGETAWQQSQIRAAQDLPAFYDFSMPLALPRGTTEPFSADAIMVVGPQQPLDAASLWTLDQAIMRGIPAVFLIDTKRFSSSQFMLTSQSSGLELLLETYGLKIGTQMICDMQCETVGLTQNMGGLSMTTSMRYPFVPLSTNFEKNHPILRGIQAVGIPFPTRLDPGTLPEGVKFTPLIYSSEKSWLAPAQHYSVAPTSVPPFKPGESHGPYTLAGVLEGTFPSHFAGKPAPVKGGEVLAKSVPTQIFVMSTSRLLDPNMPEFAGGGALISNALAYLTHDDILIGIQVKGNILRPLKEIPPAAQDGVKVLCILGTPILSILWGLWRWRRRRNWRHSVSANFQNSPS